MLRYAFFTKQAHKSQMRVNFYKPILKTATGIQMNSLGSETFFADRLFIYLAGTPGFCAKK
jgi:hypothetical protein